MLSGNPAAAVLGLLASLYAPAAAAGIVAALHSARGRARLQRPAAFLVRLCQRLARRLAGDPAAIAARVLQRLGSFNLGLPAIASAFGYALVNWAADTLCLAAAIAVIGAAVPWDTLLLVWSAGAAAASFSPTLWAQRRGHRPDHRPARSRAPERYAFRRVVWLVVMAPWRCAWRADLRGA